MQPFDVLLITILAGFTLWGLWFGLLHSLGSLLGTVVGAIVASRFNDVWSQTNLGRVITFIVLFVVASKLVGVVFFILERVFKIAAVIPGLKTLNRLAGAVFGFLEGSILLGSALYFLSIFPVGNIAVLVKSSQSAPFFLQVGKIVVPFFPEFLRKVKEMGLLR